LQMTILIENDYNFYFLLSSSTAIQLLFFHSLWRSFLYSTKVALILL